MRKIIIKLICILMLVSTVSNASELAAIARDGRYIVIDTESFEFVDVGDLRRFGLFTIDNAIAGSSVDRAVLEGDISTEQVNANGLASKHIRVKLMDLGRRQSKLTEKSVIDFEEGNMRWVNGDKQHRIVLSQAQPKTVIYNADLQSMSSSTVEVPLGIEHSVSCAGSDNKIIIGTWFNKMVYPSGKGEMTVLDGVGVNQAFHLTDVAQGCFMLMVSKPGSADDKTLNRRVIDIKNNKAMAIFEAVRPSVPLIYNKGKYVVEQTLISAANAGQLKPIGILKLYNAQTGRVIRSADIAGISAKLAKVIKSGSVFFAVLVGEYKIQIVNLQTFTLDKTIKIPFKRFTLI